MDTEDAKQLDDKEHKATESKPHIEAPRRKNRPLTQGAIIGIAASIAVTTGIIGFIGGTQYQKATSSSAVPGRDGFGGSTAMGRMGRPGGMSRNGSFGEVTAISEGSITISLRARGNSSNSSTKTYAINSSTIITVDGNAGSASSIQKGDTVMIETDSSNHSTAAIIRVGMGNMPGGQTQSSTTGATSSQT